MAATADGTVDVASCGSGHGSVARVARATAPSVACEAMPRKQKRLAASGDRALLEGLAPEERMRVCMEAMIERKAERCGTSRCQRCWFPLDSSGTNFCICAKLRPLSFSKRVRFLVYMHPRDWYNAGDDAKLLLSAAPGHSDIFVFGRPGDDERLTDALALGPSVLLFPDDTAREVDEFLGSLASGDEVACGDGGARGGPIGDAELSVVVIDGTWNNVKQMQRHFSRTVGPSTPHVRLRPESLSVYARKQTRKDGISSVEAVALLLREMGEAHDVCDSLVHYVEVNNEALKMHPVSPDN